MEIENLPNARSCKVVIWGRLSDRLGSAFPEMTLERGPGQTVLRGRLDQVRFDALVDRLRDLGIEPVSVDVDD